MPLALSAESWAAADLQVLAGALVFAMGVYAAIYQFSLARELHGVVRRYTFRPFSMFLLAESAGFLLLVWAFQGGIADVGLGDDPIWPSLVITASALGIAVAWYLFLRDDLKRRVIRCLERDLVGKFEENRALSIDLVRQLIYVGAKSDSEEDKQLALESLNKLAAIVQAQPGYNGYGLEALLRDYCAVVFDPKNPGYDRNFETAIRGLNLVRERSRDLPVGAIAEDCLLARQSLLHIAKHGIGMVSDRCIRMAVEYVKDDSEILFEIGASAVIRSKFDMAQAILFKLESNLDHHYLSAITGDVAYYLGFVSHLFTFGSTSLRAMALSSFQDYLQDSGGSTGHVLEEARRHHFSIQRFETADRLSAMIAELV